jgi:8-oxo-dGTP diphosphatase
MAAGGVVVTAGRSPLIAVVKRRKDDGWVLPRGKLRPKESALVAALREVERETGHSVAVGEFLGTVSSESGGRPKIIQFWLMASQAAHKPVNDDKTVKWLPLNAAVATLTEPLEQSFLAEIGRQRRHKFKKSANGRSASGLRANGRTGDGARVERAKGLAHNSVAPGFIRKFLKRLTNPREVPSRGRVPAG